MNNCNNHLSDIKHPGKKLLITIFLIITVAISAQSQTTKGLWIVGGSFSFNHVNKVTSISLAPNGGYLCTDHLAVGTGIGISTGYSNNYNYFSTGLYPFVRYYLGQKQLQPFGSLATGTNYSHFKNDDESYYGNNRKDWVFYLSIGVGVSYFLNENAAIEGQIGYSFSGETTFINFGFQIYLGNRKE